MADDTVDEVRFQSIDSSKGLDCIPVQLQFPTINLDTSFESLLSNSSSSSRHTAVMSRINPTPALDESWASLDALDYSHEDDHHSETTDTGSLIDLSSTHDTESAAGDDAQSETDLEEERGTDIATTSASHVWGDHQQEEQEESGHTGSLEDTVMIQRSMVREDKDAMDLRYDYRISDVTLPNGRKHLEYRSIYMTISKSSLLVAGKPFNLAYYGALSARESKNELLGKIGAALVTPSTTDSISSPESSPCFNIVPIEFGPGSKPAFADLVPSQPQMSIDDVEVLQPVLNELDTIRLAVNRRLVLTSKPNRSFNTKKSSYRPDLLVVQISQDDFVEDFLTINKVLELARRHAWPTITITTDTTDGLCPVYHCHSISMAHFTNDRVSSYTKQPIDLDSFLRIESDALNHHIRHIMDKTAESRSKSTSNISEFVSTALNATKAWVTGHDTATTSRYLLEAVEAVPMQSKQEEEKTSLLKELQQMTLAFDVGKVLKDLLLGLSIFLLGVYIVSFSQSSQETDRMSAQGNTTITFPVETTAPATLVASSPVSSSSATSTEVLSVDRDVMVYDPVSFDQMWQRLTGRPTNDNVQTTTKDDALIDELPSKAMDEEESSLRSSLVGGLSRSADAAVQAIYAVNTASQQRFVEIMERAASRRRLRQDKRDQIQTIHHKLQEFWSEASDSVRGLGQQSRDHLDGLVEKSQNHIRQARWASERRLGSIVLEQKKLLSRAQNHAKALAHEMPQRKKRGLFGRR